MTRNRFNQTRRNVLKVAAVGAVAVPLSRVLMGDRARAGDLPQVSEDDPAAKGLMYVHDATKANRQAKGGTPGDKQLCSNCQFIQANEGEWRPCQLFPGKSVNADGWCSAWALKVS